jgi:hypothetical protein
MQDDLNGPNFREDQPIAVEPHAVAVLRIGDRVIATLALGG